tara:strand:- start:636 stop:776 length:141 start_codon:yes stop_codon:yes gene_type:complete
MHFSSACPCLNGVHYRIAPLSCDADLGIAVAACSGVPPSIVEQDGF